MIARAWDPELDPTGPRRCQGCGARLVWVECAGETQDEDDPCAGCDPEHVTPTGDWCGAIYRHPDVPLGAACPSSAAAPPRFELPAGTGV